MIAWKANSIAPRWLGHHIPRKVLRLKKIRSSFLTLIAALIILQSSEAMASYRFNVKVVNNSGQDTELRHIEYEPKGNPRWKGCHDDGDYEELSISAGSSTVKPNCTSSSQKWQRQMQIMVSIFCKSSGATRDLYFPRGSNKFFARDHTQKNGDKYVTKIKAGDCWASHGLS